MIKGLEGFYHWVELVIMGMTAELTPGGELECLLVDESLDTAGFWIIRECI